MIDHPMAKLCNGQTAVPFLSRIRRVQACYLHGIAAFDNLLTYSTPFPSNDVWKIDHRNISCLGAAVSGGDVGDKVQTRDKDP